MVPGVRRTVVMALVLGGALLPACATTAPAATGAEETALEGIDPWADFDPRAEPLDAAIVREWREEGVVVRSVGYRIGTFLGEPARMAAFFARPDGPGPFPGLLHLHGGGQRASLEEVAFHARQGYACLSINWGGREMDRAGPGDRTTDWGAVDPTQRDPSGYFDLRPRRGGLDAFESARNNHWYLLTIGARRGLTFLERQPEVDPDRLGVYGHSMGGTLSVYVAGSDARVKAAVPSCGGSGFRTEPWPLLPEVTLERPLGDPALFAATLGLESSARRVAAPLLWLGATNDFHGIMDDTYRTGALLPGAETRYAFTPHMNHRLSPVVAVTRSLWFDRWLRDGVPLPATPATTLVLADPGGVPRFHVEPDRPAEVDEVRVFYAVDPDPRARFWRSGDVTREGNVWSAPLPLLATDAPLFAFAQVAWRISERDSEPHALRTDRVALSSLLRVATPEDLAAAGTRATDAPTTLVDDFSRGDGDWYRLEPKNPHHWEWSTRKIADPKWRGPAGARLAIDVETEETNDLVVVLTENVFRSYRGRERTFVASARLRGGNDRETVALAPADFTAADGTPLESWSAIDLLSLRAYAEPGGKLVGSKTWRGPQPVFRRVAWER